MRADEHEGVLNDTNVKRMADQSNAKARELLSGDLAYLSENAYFLRWIQKYIHPMLTQDVPVNNGSTLAHWHGRRQLLTQIITEMEDEAPGFLTRVLAAREQYESDLRDAAQKEQ